MNLNELVDAIVNDFIQTMKEEGFNTFSEMKNCYWWDSQDIKDEVDYICNKQLNIPNDGLYNYYLDDLKEDLTYSKLIKKVYSELKKRKLYGENEY